MAGASFPLCLQFRQNEYELNWLWLTEVQQGFAVTHFHLIAGLPRTGFTSIAAPSRTHFFLDIDDQQVGGYPHFVGADK